MSGRLILSVSILYSQTVLFCSLHLVMLAIFCVKVNFGEGTECQRAQNGGSCSLFAVLLLSVELTLLCQRKTVAQKRNALLPAMRELMVQIRICELIVLLATELSLQLTTKIISLQIFIFPLQLLFNKRNGVEW